MELLNGKDGERERESSLWVSLAGDRSTQGVGMDKICSEVICGDVASVCQNVIGGASACV